MVFYTKHLRGKKVIEKRGMPPATHYIKCYPTTINDQIIYNLIRQKKLSC